AEGHEGLDNTENTCFNDESGGVRSPMSKEAIMIWVRKTLSRDLDQSIWLVTTDPVIQRH
ncbi:hypothetical protein HAX54_028731, partial [Datura stramonium]|nr:hypothetical protein [Datura stramonium]